MLRKAVAFRDRPIPLYKELKGQHLMLKLPFSIAFWISIPSKEVL
jgi:hypothetical protein